MKGNFMKTPALNRSKSPGTLRTGLVLGACMTGWFSLAAQEAAPVKAEPEKKVPLEKKSEADAADTYNNWIELSLGNLYVSGDRAAAQRSKQLPHGPFGGIEDFHYEQSVGKKGLLKIDGRAIFDNDDYLLKLDLSNPDIGFI